MLDRRHRLISSVLFSAAARGGRRAGTRTVVLHLLTEPADVEPLDQSGPQVGFVVSKAVGNAVTRNTVKRRLRHLARERISTLPATAVLVVRALPAASTASYSELGADLDAALRRVSKASRRPETLAATAR